MICTWVWGCLLPDVIKVRVSDTTHPTSHSWLQWSQNRLSELPTPYPSMHPSHSYPLELGLFADVGGGWPDSSKEVMGYWILSHVEAQQNFSGRDAVAGVNAGGAEEVGGQAKGRGEGAPATPGLSRAPAQSPKPALRLSCHGTAFPGAVAAAGAAAAASARAASAAEPGALPGALQLPARRRPALPWPAGWPHPTVSTRRPQPATLACSSPPHLPTPCSPLPGTLEENLSPGQTHQLLGWWEAKDWGLSLSPYTALWMCAPPAVAPPVPGEPVPSFS